MKAYEKSFKYVYLQSIRFNILLEFQALDSIHPLGMPLAF
jgi:hypothetical protein